MPQEKTTERIWRELSDRLRQFIRSRVKSTEDVDDILQSVFLRIHQRLDRLRQEERLESWVFQITRNAVSDHFRKRRASDLDVASLVDRTESVGAENANSESAACIGTLIDQLPEDQKRAVSLFKLERMPQREIADRESITLAAAKSRILRGRRNLKTLLDECCRFNLDRRGNVLEVEAVRGDCCTH